MSGLRQQILEKIVYHDKMIAYWESDEPTEKKVPLADHKEEIASEWRVSRGTLKEVLGLVAGVEEQILEIMDEDYWTANVHLNKIRTKVLACLDGSEPEKAQPKNCKPCIERFGLDKKVLWHCPEGKTPETCEKAEPKKDGDKK
jgi:hypothetical protein